MTSGARTLSALRHGSGSGTPVVLVHGVNGAAEQWSAVMERFDGRTSIAVDLRAHGESAPGGPYGAADYAADVAEVLDALDVGNGHLVGTSFGGGVVLTLAAQRPRLARSVTVLGGALSVAEQGSLDEMLAALRTLGPSAFFEQVAEASFAPGTDKTLLRKSIELAARNEPSTVEQILRAAFTADVSDVSASVRAPALVLTGEHDQTCPPTLGRAMADALGCEHRILSGRDHLAHVEDPDLIARLIESRVRDVEAPE